MKWISRSILELIWNGLMVDVESILAPFGINVGSILEANWGPFGVHFGVNLGSMARFGGGFELQTPSGPDFWLWTDFGPFFGPHVGPMLAPCWPHVGTCWASWAILAGSWNDFELILRRF